MPAGRAISLFLIDGVPDGRVACELFNWTGKAFRIPRKLIKESADRPDLRRAGVYLLFGRDDTRNEVSTAYVGEADDVIRRIPQHQDKEFWTEALLFVSKDENLNRAHIKFLEHTIYAKALEVGRYEVVNGSTPNCPQISEVERAVMTEFFENLQLLTGALGYKLFEPLVSATASESDHYVITAARGANARGVFGSEGMVVLKGSEAANTTVPSIPDSTNNLRQLLMTEGVLVDQGGRLVFTRDHLFASPSGAAGVVLGRSANGWVEWKDRAGRPLKENEE
ncbi:MAG: GIY-YIG nuclease family protein [Gemmataceae bacterium]